MKIYIVSAYFYDEFDGCKQIHSTVERAFDSKAAAEKYVAAGGKFEVAYAKFSHYSIGEVEFETQAVGVIKNSAALTALRPEDMIGGKIQHQLSPFDTFDYGKPKKCLFEGLPSHDNRGRILAYGLSCPCPKCSPQC